MHKAEEGDADTAARIRANASSYVVSPDVLEAEGRRRVEEYQAGVEALRKGEEPGPEKGRDHPREAPRDRQRSRRNRPPSGVPGEPEA